MDSKRLRCKALLPLNGIPAIVFQLRRLKTSKTVKEFIFATTDRIVDDELAEVVMREDVAVFRGATEDVLGRCVTATMRSHATHFVRITGDCPFVSGETLDEVLTACQTLEKDFDLVTTKPAYPHGIDYEVAPMELLRTINRMNLLPEEREHMMNYIYHREHQFRLVRLARPSTLAGCEGEFLLDTPADYEKIRSWLGSSPVLKAAGLKFP